MESGKRIHIKVLVFVSVILLMMGAFSLTHVWAEAPENSTTVKWDHNDPMPEGYRIFQRTEGQSYDYSQPVWEGPQDTAVLKYPGPDYPDMPVVTGLTGSWDKPTSSITLNWDQSAPADNTRTDYWIVRAYQGTEESADSLEVNRLHTTQNSVTKWEVFYSLTAGGPYTSLGDVTATGAGSTGSVTQPLTAVAAGERKTVYFTVVSFGQGATYSANSAEISIDVDRTVLQPPVNISVTATVPVQ